MEKLVRDKIKEFSAAAQDGRVFRTATGDEWLRLLGQKAIEEAHEVADELVAEVPNLGHITEELADLSEVIATVAQHYGISPEDITQARQTKAAKKGIFQNRVVLDLSSNLERFQK